MIVPRLRQTRPEWKIVKPNKYASLFPGQGSQYLGMLSAAYERFPVVRETFNEASEAIGLDLWALTKEDNNSSINLTFYEIFLSFPTTVYYH